MFPDRCCVEFESDIAPLVIADPKSALVLADQLWADAWLESRLIAIAILERLPLDPQDQIVERLQVWGRDCREDALLDALLNKGAAPIQNSFPDEYFLLVENWLSDQNLSSQKLALRAMPALVENPEFENLPALYRMLSQLVRESSSSLEFDLIQIVRALGRRSPPETAFFWSRI